MGKKGWHKMRVTSEREDGLQGQKEREGGGF